MSLDLEYVKNKRDLTKTIIHSNFVSLVDLIVGVNVAI